MNVARRTAVMPCALLLASAAGAADAPPGLDELIDRAEQIVVGRVLGEEVRLAPFRIVADAPERDWPFRCYELGVERVLKGGAASQFTLRFVGGRRKAGGPLLDPVGSPRLRAGHRYLLFVAGNGDRWVPLVGWGHGLFELVADSTGRIVLVSHGGLAVAGFTPGEWLLLNAPLEEAAAADGLLDELAAYIAARATPAGFEPGQPAADAPQ